MPTATLTFELPDEQHEFDAAIRGREALVVLWDVDQRCRSLLKYGEPSEETSKLAQEIRDMIPGDMLQ